MIPVLNGWNLTVVGSWNLAIFNPGWMQREVFQTDQFEVGMPLPPLAGIHFRHDNLELLVHTDRIIARPGVIDDDDLEKASTAVKRIVAALPHTPILGLGVNFEFLVSDPDEGLMTRLSDSESAILADKDFILQKHQIIRSLSMPGEQGWLCNLTISFVVGGDVTFSFNFHADVNSAVRVGELVDNKFREFKLIAVETIMKEIFEQELD